MYLRFSASKSLSVLAVLGLTALQPDAVRAADTTYGRPIEFSQPKRSDVVTNLNQLNPKRDGLRELEEDLYKPFRSFSPASSLDGVVVPPRTAPSQMQSKKARELRERRKNWVFMDPDDLTGVPSAADLFKMPEYEPDGKEKKEVSPLEKYYQRLERETRSRNGQRSNGDSLKDPKRPDSGDDMADIRDDLSDPNDPDRELHRLFNPRAGGTSFGPDTTRGTFSDIFGLGNNMPSPEQLELRKANMREFDRLLESTAAPSLPNSLSGIDARGLTPGLSFDLPGLAHPPAIDSSAGSINTAFHPAILPDSNVRPVTTLNATPAPLPTVEAPKLMSPSAPLDFPRRKF